MHIKKVSLIKGEAPVKLVALFLGKIERHEIPEWDPVGTETLGFLIEALKVLDIKTQTWGSIAKYVLKKANDKFRFSFYTGTLRVVAQHVSTEVAEQIVAHFVSFGEVDAVIEIAINKIQRFVTSEEVTSMLEYHNKKNTASTSPVWNSLRAVGGDEMTPKVNKVLERIKRLEDDFIIT